MKLVRQTKLHFQQGNSDKVYEVDLCEAGEGEFLVNFRYGRRGAALREGTKTAFPMSRAKAEGIFDALVTEKTAKGYQITAGTGTVAAQPRTVRDTDARPRRSAAGGDRETAGRRSDRPGSEEIPLETFAGDLARRRMENDRDRGLDRRPGAAVKSEIDFWCAAWALGRCGEAKHAVVLELIAERAKSVPWVLSMVAEARAALLPDEPVPSGRP